MEFVGALGPSFRKDPCLLPDSHWNPAPREEIFAVRGREGHSHCTKTDKALHKSGKNKPSSARHLARVSATLLIESKEYKSDLQEDMRAHYIYDNHGEASLKTWNCSKNVRPGEQRRRGHALFILPIVAVLVTRSGFALVRVITHHIAFPMEHTRRFGFEFRFRV